MTTPAAPQPSAPAPSPAPAPAAPAAPAQSAPTPAAPAPDTNLGLDRAEDMANLSEAAMSSILGLAETPATPTEPAVPDLLFGDDHGPDEQLEPLVPQSGTQAAPGPRAQPAPAPEPQAPPQPVAEPSSPSPETPVPTPFAPTTEQPAAEPAQAPTQATPAAGTSREYKVIGPDGKEFPLPEGFTLTYKAAGKVREGRTLDQVVRAAQWGEHNLEREQAISTAQVQVADAERRVAEVQGQHEQQLRQYDAWFSRVLSDPDFYQRAVQQFAIQNSPEARADRAEQALADERRRSQEQNEALYQRHFVATELSPRWDRLEAENKLVTKEEIMGQFALLTAPMLVSGRLPTARLSDVARLIDSELSTWVKGMQASRDAEKRQTETRVETAQTREALAKRQTARAAATPTNGAPTSTKPKTFKTADEWTDAVLPLPSGG